MRLSWSLLPTLLLFASTGALAQSAAAEDVAADESARAEEPATEETATPEDTPAEGQESSGEWVPFPGDASPSKLSDSERKPPERALPPPPLPNAPAPTTVDRTAKSAAPLEPNTVSLYGARALEPFGRAIAFTIGFPLVTARASMGVTERLDVGLGFDTFYGVMNEGRLTSRYLLHSGTRFHFGAKLELGYASFVQAPNAEGHGARWLTGRRNFNVAPSIVVSTEGQSPRASRFFFEATCLLAVDTQPYQKDPLAGVPGAFQLSANVPLRGGVEVPFSASTSFVVQLGFDFHFRSDDSPFMPAIAVGMVTSL